jgi:hypothetical protein
VARGMEVMDVNVRNDSFEHEQISSQTLLLDRRNDVCILRNQD